MVKKGWARSRGLGGLVLLGTLVVLGAGSCSDDGSQVAGRIKVEGRAEIGAPGDNVDDVVGDKSVRFGQRVRLREGTAVVTLRGDRRIELRPGSQVELRSVERAGDKVVAASLLDGDVLVTAPREALVVSSDSTEATVRGTARLLKGLSLSVGVYSGTVELATAGSTARVDALRQMVVPAAGVLPARPDPLEFSSSDPWDQRFLGDAVELGNELFARSQGFSAQAPAPRDVAFYRALLPALASEPAFDTAALNAFRPSGETLVGAAIALSGTKATFAERWQSVFAFRDEGAQWGLVAADQGVARAPLLAVVDAAIGRGPAIFGVPLPEGSAGGTGSSPGSSSGGQGGTSSGTTSPGGGQTGSSTTPGSGSTPPPPGSSQAQPPGPGPLNTGTPVDDTVNSLVEALSGLLRALGLS